MTNTNDLIKTLAIDALRAYTPDTDYADNELSRLTRDLQIAAARDLLESLTLHNRDYYFSDSTYDELSNPSRTLAICDTFNNYFYDDDDIDSYIAELDEFIECLDYTLPYDYDASLPADFTLTDISNLLKNLA